VVHVEHKVQCSTSLRATGNKDQTKSELQIKSNTPQASSDYTTLANETIFNDQRREINDQQGDIFSTDNSK